MDIILEHVFKAYGQKQLFSDFSHCFSSGRIHCIMGASGCGKTTLLRMIAGLERADAGKIIMPTQTKISAVFQEDRLIENLSAEKNVLLTAQRGFAHSDAHALLEALELGAWAKKQVCHLSGGMKRRVALARALALDFDLLLLDEPFTGLDGDTAKRAMDALLRHVTGRTVICITHHPETADSLGADILHL